MSMRLPKITSLSLLIAFTTSCANYKFEEARLPDGTWDIQKLATDLEASGDDALVEGMWIPLIYTDFTAFSNAGTELEGGYNLVELEGYGPLFLGGEASRSLMTEDLTEVESSSRWWAVWGVAANAAEDTVETIAGTRTHERWRALVVLGDEDRSYDSEKGEASDGAASAGGRAQPVQ